MKTFMSLLAVAGLTSHVGAKSIPIAVGSSGLTFSPNSVQAAVGDTLVFTFYPLNHSVVMGDFANACHPATSGGFFSGFVPTPQGKNAKTFSVAVTSTEPMVFYCSQPKLTHCKSGMYGVVNPSGGKTLEAYGALAKDSTSVSSPPMPFGGLSGSGSGSSSAGGSSMGPTSAPSSRPSSAPSSGITSPPTSAPTGGPNGGSTTTSAVPGVAAGVTTGLGSLFGAAIFALLMA